MRRRVVCLATYLTLYLCQGTCYCPLSRCLPTPLDYVPEGEWLCPACVKSEGLVEGVKGLVIWLWYAPDVCHHRAVVDGVYKELQGERLGSVTKVHVRFEAVPGDVSRSVEPLPLASLKHISPQVAEELLVTTTLRAGRITQASPGARRRPHASWRHLGRAVTATL